MKTRAGPCGLHLFDRISGLNILLDEICIPEESWALAPRFVSIALTNSCDLACPYCYAPKIPARLNLERVITWLSELDAHGCLGVGFGGGEPTLYAHLVDLCRYGAQETQLAITFTTHAHHLDDTLVQSLAGSVHFLRVSMDGVGATYERLRRRSFATLKVHMTALRKVAPFGINYVVNDLTMKDLSAAADLASELGAAELLLLPEQPVHGKGGIDEGTAHELREWVALYEGRVPLTISESGMEGMPTCDPFPLETGLRAFAHIDASGILKTSSYATSGVAIRDDGTLRAIKALRALTEREAK
jgi:MoaA/NifB/PqqE/SkfB family radical SAM enzyme